MVFVCTLSYTAGGGGTISIDLYAKDIRYGCSNDPISFVEPLTSDPTTSIFNLNQVKTTYSVSCFVKEIYLGSPGVWDTTTLFGLMLAGSGEGGPAVLPTFTFGDEIQDTVTVYVKSIQVVRRPDRFYVNNAIGLMDQMVEVEIGLEKATLL